MDKTLINASDAELLRLMLAGEAAAFALLYDRHQGGIYRFALRMSDSEALAQDVTQDVFLALMGGIGQFDPERGTLAGYLYGIARHRVLQLLKRERSFVQIDEEQDETNGTETLVATDNPLLDLSRSETIEAVRHAVSALPVHYREVVLLCNLHELNYEQAATAIGCAVGTVRSRLHRARLLLLEKLRGVHSIENASQEVNEGRAATLRSLPHTRFAL